MSIMLKAARNAWGVYAYIQTQNPGLNKACSVQVVLHEPSIKLSVFQRLFPCGPEPYFLNKLPVAEIHIGA